MAEHQGNSSNQISQAMTSSERSCPYENLDLRPSTDNEFQHSDFSAEKRRQLKLTLGSSGSFPFGSSGNSSFQPFMCKPLQTSSNLTNEDRHNSSPVLMRDCLSRVRPFKQEPQIDKSRERFRMCPSVQSTGKLQVSPESVYDFTSEDLQDLGEIGRGAFGTVNKMVHRRSNTVMAVKRIRSTVDEKEQKELLMDLEVVMKSNECPYIVQFYGALFKEKAYSEKHEREVAIKGISKKHVPPKYFETFVPRELEFVKDLKHPNIIQYLEAIVRKNTVYIVMELAEKGSLRDLIRTEKYLDEDTARRYLLQILDAVEYCYEKGVVHRDIKLGNLLLDEADNIKLADFGVAEGGMFPVNGRPQTSVAFLGSRPYAAPEVWTGERHDPYISDVWSIGVVLYRMVFHRRPYYFRKLTLDAPEIVRFPMRPPVSPELKALLRGILSPASERLTVQQIREHSWVAMGTTRDKVVNGLGATGDEATAKEPIAPGQTEAGQSKEPSARTSKEATTKSQTPKETEAKP